MISGSTKRCWSCEATTRYEVGWCSACWLEIPIEAKNAVEASYHCEPYGGAIRMAVADTLNAQRRKIKKLTRLNLDDLEI